jgi:pimeloyl-ACP methyl ester carboxylesterase
MPARVNRLVALSVSHPATYFGPLSQYERSWYMLLFQFVGLAEEALQKDNWRLLRAWMGSAQDLDVYLQHLDHPGALTAGLNWYRANANPAIMFGLAEPLPWPAVQAPTLGVWSTCDAYCGEHGFLDPQPYVAGPYRYERIEGASHWIPLDQPERLNELLLEFFRSGT